MKIFISMPMKAKSTEQVRVEINKVYNFIKERLPEAELIDSVIDDADKEIAVKGDSVGIWYLGKSIQLLSTADIVFFVNDWSNARGCLIEREVAKKYGKFCVEIKFTET